MNNNLKKIYRGIVDLQINFDFEAELEKNLFYLVHVDL